jgi:hypothetical protein
MLIYSTFKAEIHQYALKAFPNMLDQPLCVRHGRSVTFLYRLLPLNANKMGCSQTSGSSSCRPPVFHARPGEVEEMIKMRLEECGIEEKCKDGLYQS